MVHLITMQKNRRFSPLPFNVEQTKLASTFRI